MDAFDVDGHDCDALEDVFRRSTKAPKCVSLHTIKGKGVSIMEDDVAWHYRSPNQVEVVQALRELR
ncbi:hypothetical protein SALBM311S_09833 [Streptomyces alboniger]